MSKNKSTHVVITFVTIFAVKGAMAADNISTTKPAIADYTRPISFEPNRGQTDKQIDFLAHGAGYDLFLSHADAVMVFQRDGTSVRMKPVRANASASAEAIEQQPSKSNYFIGNDPDGWHTNVPNYAKVQYRNVYPGIDLIYYGNQRQLEYDFVLAPGADAHSILLDFRGASKADLDSEGNVVMHTSGGDLRWHKPFAYQEVNGARKLIACAYTPKGRQRLAFKLAAYDRTKPLIIDPVLEYSTYLGGSGDQYGDGDHGTAIAVDAAGNAYVTGSTYSPDFPTKKALQSFYKGDVIGTSNAFVTKLDAAGRLVYSTYLGGSGSQESFGSTDFPAEGDEGNGIAVDGHGNAYVAGMTGSFDFPIKNAFQSSINGFANAFLTKLDSAGNALVYSTYLGGNNLDGGAAVAVDSKGNAYVTGFTISSNFPTKNAFQGVWPGSPNFSSTAFITKFDAAGTSLVYSTFLGGSGGDSGNGIAVDRSGNAYVTGVTGSTDFPIKNAFQSHNKEACGFCGNAFVTKLDTPGTALVYSTYLGGSSNNNSPGDAGAAIAVDAYGNAYVTGNTNSSDFPVVHAFQQKLKSTTSAFVTKFDNDGDSLVYSTYLGGSGAATGLAIALDRYNNAYITGNAASNFPLKNAFQPVYRGESTDAFVTKFDAAGTALVYSSYLGGTGYDSGNGIAVDVYGNAYVIGATNSIDFPIKDAFQNTLEAPGGDAFVTKISAH